MDILRCKSPEMIRKEILMNLIVYNCIGKLMYKAVEKAKIHVRDVSFKGSLQAIRNWSPQFNRENLSRTERHKLLNVLYGQ